jgi:hypothetical protein
MEKTAFNNGTKNFHQQIGLKFLEETSDMPHLEHCIIWFWKVDTSASRSEMHGKF